jgi:hypothetical protein
MMMCMWLLICVFAERDSKERHSKEKEKSKRKDKDVVTVSSLDGFIVYIKQSNLDVIN